MTRIVQKIVFIAGVLFTVLSLTVVFAGMPPVADPIINTGGAVGVDLNDNARIRYGTGNDYEQVFDGSNFITKQLVSGDIQYVYNDGDGAYWRKLHIDTGSMAPQNAVNTVNYGSIIVMDADTDYVYWDTIVGDDWDGSDMIIKCVSMLAFAETAGDDIDLDLNVFFTADHENTSDLDRWQQLSISHDIGAFNTQYDQHRFIFRIDEDDAGEELHAGDLIGFQMRLNSVASVAGIFLNTCDVWYKTKYAQQFFNGTIPSAG